MGKKKLTDEQKEMLTLIPKGLPKLSQASRLVLANIIFKYGTEFARKHGFVFRTNEDMAQDTGLSKQTVITSVRNLETMELIESKRGKRGQASEYYLSDEIKQKINFTCNDIRNNSNEAMEQYLSKGQITEIMGQITDTVCERMNEFISLKIKDLSDNLINAVTQIMESYLTTDSEKEKEIEIETLNSIEQSNEQRPQSVSISSNNKYVDSVFTWLDNELDYLYTVKDKYVYDGMEQKIAKYVNQIDRSKFTEKQWEVVNKKVDRWDKIEDAKIKYFSRQFKKKPDNSKTNASQNGSEISEYGKTSNNLIRTTTDNGYVQCGNYSEKEAHEWAAKEVKKYKSYESWVNHTKDYFNRTFCEGWGDGDDSNAMMLFIWASDYAKNYYQNIKDRETQANEEDLAPWDRPF